MIKNIKTRLSSDSGESSVVSNLLLIVFAIIIVVAMGTVIYKAINDKSAKVAGCINKAGVGNLTTGGSGTDKGDTSCLTTETH